MKKPWQLNELGNPFGVIGSPSPVSGGSGAARVVYKQKSFSCGCSKSGGNETSFIVLAYFCKIGIISFIRVVISGTIYASIDKPMRHKNGFRSSLRLMDA